MFLLSAIVQETRQNVKQHLNVLLEYLLFILEEAGENHIKNAELPPIYLNVSIYCSLVYLLTHLVDN